MLRAPRIPIVLFALVTASPAAAQELPAQAPMAVQYKNLTAARVNPLGLVNLAEMSFRLRLYESESKALKQNYVGIGLAPGASPAWGRIGVLAEVQPLTILRLWSVYEVVGYFSSFDLFASFPSPNDDFSDTAIEARADLPATESYSVAGAQLTLGATLQLKIGPIAARSLFRAVHADYDLRSGDRVFYDQLYDALVPDGGWLLANDVDVLWVSDFGLIVGPRWTWVQPFYADRHYAPGDDPNAPPDNHIHRRGVLAAYRLSESTSGRFHTPTVILVAQWHLAHRWRTGTDVSRALPYVGAAFQFQGDLLADE